MGSRAANFRRSEFDQSRGVLQRNSIDYLARVHLKSAIWLRSITLRQASQSAPVPGGTTQNPAFILYGWKCIMPSS